MTEISIQYVNALDIDSVKKRVFDIIEGYKRKIQIRDIVLPILKSFEGKQVNKRLTTAVMDAVKQVHQWNYASLDIGFTYITLKVTFHSNDADRSTDTIYFQLCNSDTKTYFYSDVLKSMYYIVDLEKRIKKEQDSLNLIEGLTKRYNDAIAELKQVSAEASVYDTTIQYVFGRIKQ